MLKCVKSSSFFIKQVTKTSNKRSSPYSKGNLTIMHTHSQHFQASSLRGFSEGMSGTDHIAVRTGAVSIQYII